MKRLFAFLFAAAILAAQAPTHSVTLTWIDTVNPACTTYNIYRLTGSCPATEPATTAGYTQLNAAAITVKTYVDTTVAASTTYCYIGTAGTGAAQSAPSTDAGATVPGTFPPQMLQISTN